jgi:hypothetical protein
MQHRWNETDRGKTEVLGEKPVPVPLCPPQIPHGLTRDRTRASAVGYLAIYLGLLLIQNKYQSKFGVLTGAMKIQVLKIVTLCLAGSYQEFGIWLFHLQGQAVEQIRYEDVIRKQATENLIFSTDGILSTLSYFLHYDF